MHILAPIAVLMTLSVAGYLDYITGEFVFDDSVGVLNNPGVKVIPTNFSAIFRNDFWGENLLSDKSHKSYRPLTTLMFHIERAYFGFHDAKQMKYINLVIHCINTLLIWGLLRNLHFDRFLNTQNSNLATLTSAIFAVHPVHAEVICAVVGRADLMFCLFYLLALHFAAYNKNPLGCFIITFIIIIFTAIGLLFKETAVSIPIACIGFCYVRFKIYLLKCKHQLRIILCLQNIILLLFTFILIMCRLAIQNFNFPQFKSMDNPIASSQNVLTRILTQNYLYTLNFWILLCPQWLCFDWAFDCIQLITNIWDIRIFGVLILYFVLVLIVFQCKKYPGFLLGLCLLISPFLPASGLFKVGFVLAERILYVPSIGSCLLVAYSFVSVKSLIKQKHLTFVFDCIIFLLLVLFLLRTRERSYHWTNEILLFKSALKVCPKNAKVHYNIARSVTDNNTKLAFYHYHKAIELFPRYESALMNLGNLYREIGSLSAAEHYIRLSIKESPNLASAWMNLGIVYAMNKKYSNAIVSYETALKLRRNYALCHYNYGNLFREQKLYSKAIQHWQEAININPNLVKAWINILTLLDNQGFYDDAIRLSDKAVLILPKNTNILFIRATILGKIKLYVEAEKLFKYIIKLEPLNFLFYTNLGVLYHRWKKYDNASYYYKHAIEISPTQAKAAKRHLQELLERLEKHKYT